MNTSVENDATEAAAAAAADVAAEATSAESDIAPNSGDISFMRDDLNCGICFELCENAVETPCCGHLFCEGCVKNVRKCPMCRTDCKFRPSMVLRRLISNMPTHCPYCHDVFTVGSLATHESSCSQRPHSCSLCVNSQEQFTTADLLQHFVVAHADYLVRHNDAIATQRANPSINPASGGGLSVNGGTGIRGDRSHYMLMSAFRSGRSLGNAGTGAGAPTGNARNDLLVAIRGAR